MLHRNNCGVVSRTHRTCAKEIFMLPGKTAFLVLSITSLVVAALIMFGSLHHALGNIEPF